MVVQRGVRLLWEIVLQCHMTANFVPLKLDEYRELSDTSTTQPRAFVPIYPYITFAKKKCTSSESHSILCWVWRTCFASLSGLLYSTDDDGRSLGHHADCWTIAIQPHTPWYLQTNLRKSKREVLLVSMHAIIRPQTNEYSRIKWPMTCLYN